MTLPRLTAPYSEGMPVHDRERALEILVSQCVPPTCSARQRLDLLQLECQVRALPSAEPHDLTTALKAVLTLRPRHPTARHPAWRALHLDLIRSALERGVPARVLVEACHAAQLLADSAGQPRLHGEPLVQRVGHELQFAADLAAPVRTTLLN